jgi:hypothetical protein
LRNVLDEGVPRQIIPLLKQAGCSVESFPKAWKGLRNGQLLARLHAGGFDCLITCDKNFAHQQNLSVTPVALVVLPAQRLEQLVSCIPAIANAVSQARAGYPVIMPNSR